MALLASLVVGISDNLNIPADAIINVMWSNADFAFAISNIVLDRRKAQRPDNFGVNGGMLRHFLRSVKKVCVNDRVCDVQDKHTHALARSNHVRY